MKMLKEFKAFVMKGNILDLAVAVIIGAAFKAIVTSFVNDILMPPIGIILGGVDFAELAYVLKEATEESAAVTISYGLFIQRVVDFLITALVIFMVIKAYNKFERKKEEAVPIPAPPKQEVLLEEIRELLKHSLVRQRVNKLGEIFYNYQFILHLIYRVVPE